MDVNTDYFGHFNEGFEHEGFFFFFFFYCLKNVNLRERMLGFVNMYSVFSDCIALLII